MKDKHHEKEESTPKESNAEQVEKSEEQPEQPAQAEGLQQQLDDMRTKYLYLLSDFENYKRNVAKERLELQQTAGRDIMAALLSVLDDFDRAAKNGGLNEGMALIHHKLLQTLQSKGLAALDYKPGEPFNPDTQEAVAEIPAPAENLKGNIVDVVEKGYQLGDRIIRYSKVVVGK
ncbi:MAG: nucleotide exchange factor GrpE [Saprospiraceae bacterium]|jgi:molecular chaperone GrpE|nr:nucleotide exchange factor GrpE [Saprospiraceae bacterium]